MNISAALKQLDSQIKAENLEAHQYTLFRGQVGVVLLSSKELPSRPILARGIAIQNPLDTPSPKIRLFWALRRALHAYKHRVNSEPINLSADYQLEHVPPYRFHALLEATCAAFYLDGRPTVFKSQYAPTLPETGPAHKFESAILERLNREASGLKVKDCSG